MNVLDFQIFPRVEAERHQKKLRALQRTKAFALGLLIVALLTTNAAQLHNMLALDAPAHPFFFYSLTSIGLSIFFQAFVMAGLGLQFGIKEDQTDVDKSRKINKLTAFWALLIALANIAINVFDVISKVKRT